jgi:hypothetical protein
MGEYNYRNCQSLFGYAEGVHKRSGGVCQLCDAGSGDKIDFDLWRQLTVEHLIGESQGGYLKEIETAISQKFNSLSASKVQRLAAKINEKNTVTACRFCNSVTSRAHSAHSIKDLISASGVPEEAQQLIEAELDDILSKKRLDVKCKLESIRHAFDTIIEPDLTKARSRLKHLAADTKV